MAFCQIVLLRVGICSHEISLIYTNASCNKNSLWFVSNDHKPSCFVDLTFSRSMISLRILLLSLSGGGKLWSPTWHTTALLILFQCEFLL